MDTETKRLLGGGLIGVLLICVGLVLRLADTTATDALSGAAILGGGLVTLICLGRIGVGLARAT